jgi:FAD synthetase
MKNSLSHKVSDGRKVMVFGTFDGLHEGHLNFFEQARERGDFLIAVAGRDVNIKKIKGHFPKNRERDRFSDLQRCKLVDKPVLGYEEDVYMIIETLKPDVICLGYDQVSFSKKLKAELKKRDLKIEIFRMKAYKPKEMHSSILKKKS